MFLIKKMANKDRKTLDIEMDKLNLLDNRNVYKTEQAEQTKVEIENTNLSNDKKDSSETESATSPWEYNTESDHDGSPAKDLVDTRPCPLKFVKPCNWFGPIDNPNDMIEHCLEKHSKNVFISDNQKLTVSNFIELVPRKYYILFCELNNIFRLTWDLDVATKLIRFGVYFLYDFELDVEYVYEIDFLHSRKKVIKLKGPCYHLYDEEEMFLEKIYFTLPYDMVKKYCDSDGSLTFTVKISMESQLDED